MATRLAWVLLISISLAGCGKSANQVPNVAVNFQTLLTDPRLTPLSSAGHGVTISGYGVAGIIIYKTVAGNNYVAYDRCSTVNPENNCAVTLDAGAFTATDPCSGAKFLLEDGSPAKAPATLSLKAYNVAVSGNTIRVTN